MSKATSVSRSRSPVEMSELLRIALFAAAIWLVMQSALESIFARQSFWRSSWVIATVFMGPGVLAWPPVFDLAAITAAMAALYPVAFVVVLLLAGVVDRLSLKWAILAGVVLGLGFYFIDLYGLTNWVPTLTRERNWMMLLSHLAFGGATGWRLKRLQCLQSKALAASPIQA